MIVIAGLVGGALVGAGTARRRSGSAADMAQYAVGYGIACGVVALFLTIFIERLM